MGNKKLIDWKNVFLVVIGGIFGYIGGIISMMLIYR